MFYIWLGIIILLTIVELLTVQLTTVYFALSGIVALLLSFQIKSFPIQFMIFVVLGIVLMITTRPTLQKLLKRMPNEQQQKKLLGMQGIVIEEIKKGYTGTVKVNGRLWSASSSKKIKIGCFVKILEIDGMTLKVEPQDEI